MKEVLTFSIDIIDICEVKGASAVAAMILFTGTADCKNFQGRILPGGVDTQKRMVWVRKDAFCKIHIGGNRLWRTGLQDFCRK